MPLTEEEELELLELEEEEARATATPPPPPPAPERGIGSKILSGIGKVGQAVDVVTGEPARAGIRYGAQKAAELTTGIPREPLGYSELKKPFIGKELESVYGKTGGKIVAEAGNIAADITNIIPFGLIGKGMAKTGKALTGAGKSALKSGAKIKDVTAFKAGRNTVEGVKKIVDDVAKYNVQSTKGGFSGIAQNAQSRISKAMDAADEAVKKAATISPNKTVDVDNVFMNFMDDLQKGKVESVFGWEDAGSEMASNIQKALELRGLSGEQAISKLPEIKQAISKGMQVFKKGPAHISEESKLTQIGDLAYLKMKEALETVVPEVAKHNKEVHDLINVKTAAEEAVKRIGNRDKIGISDWMLLLGGPTALGSMGARPGMAAASGLVGAASITKKALSGGRGASALISTGRGIQAAAPAVDIAAKTAWGAGKAATMAERLTPKEEEEHRKLLEYISRMGGK